MAERAFYHSWQVKRVTRTQWARLSFRAHTKAQDDQHRVEQEVAALARRLFRMPGGRPAAFAYDAAADDTGCKSWVANFDDADHPAHTIGQLEGSLAGCQWLIDRFGELEAILLSDQVWYAAERFRAFRLLRIHASDAYINDGLTSLLQACHVLDPDARSLIGEVWNELVPARMRCRRWRKRTSGRSGSDLRLTGPGAGDTCWKSLDERSRNSEQGLRGMRERQRSRRHWQTNCWRLTTARRPSC